MKLSTLCYLERDDAWLMLHRTKKAHDVNEGKWIGVGGKLEDGESPEDCLVREVYEETGYQLNAWRFRGVLTFSSEGWESEYIFLYTADDFSGQMHACDEGELAWIPKAELEHLRLWEGDRVFLRMIAQDAPFFSLKLGYQGDALVTCVLDGKKDLLR